MRPAGLGLRIALAILFIVCAAAPRAEAFLLPTLRVDLGPTWRMQPEGTKSSLSVNASVGLAYILSSSAFVGGDAGYTYTHDHTQAFITGPVAAVGDLVFAFAFLSPRLVVGTDDGRTAVGMRTSIGTGFFLGTLLLEAGHQFLNTRDGLQHEARFTIGLNMTALIALTLMKLK